MRKHLDEQIVNYGQQVVINLVSSMVQYWGSVLAPFPGPSQLFSLVLKSLGSLGMRLVLHTIGCHYVLYVIVYTLSGRPKGFWEKTRRSVSFYHYFSWELPSEVCGDMSLNALNIITYLAILLFFPAIADLTSIKNAANFAGIGSPYFSINWLLNRKNLGNLIRILQSMYYRCRL